MSDLTQEQRLISIKTPLADDELLLTAFDGTEYISDLFEFKIDVLSSNHNVKPEQLIGKTVTITIQNEQKRTFNGYISRFTYGEVKADNLRKYHLTMVPWLWFLDKTHNNRIFQNKSTKDIVSQVFKDFGFNDFDFKATGNPKPREYCVQYNESDLNFVSRLLEEDGIAYFFTHSSDKHTLVLVDDKNAYQECAETNLEYSKGNKPGTQINHWEHVYEFRKGKWSLNDYDFENPSKSQLKSTPSTSKFSKVSNYEHYEYVAYHDFAGIQELSNKRIESEEVSMNTVEAAGDCSSFYAGGKFVMAKHAVAAEQGGYIITVIKHHAFDNSYLAGHESESGYKNQFACIPESIYFRPPLVHYKPRMMGPQSAIVVGPAGEEIYIDNLGRIKVQFHWDREGKKNENSTCFLRVMQPWAGAGWGTSFIPRIGMEVVVGFFEGDPDRPIVSGALYNGENNPPFNSKTQSGIRTRSTKKGTAANCNELRFDDLKGAEQIYVHAEMNMDTEVEHDETHSVENDRTKTIGHDETSSIGNDRSKSVGNDQSETVGHNKSISVSNNHSESIGKNKLLDVGGNHNESIGKNMSITVGDNLSKDVGKKITISAGDQITIKTGSASITMKSNGDITINGNNINLKGSGNVTIKGSKVSTN
jgi:type VI secretion system secreted protein VgrG